MKKYITLAQKLEAVLLVYNVTRLTLLEAHQSLTPTYSYEEIKEAYHSGKFYMEARAKDPKEAQFITITQCQDPNKGGGSAFFVSEVLYPLTLKKINMDNTIFETLNFGRLKV